MLLFVELRLNGLQFGLLLFLLATGLTLVFGIMDLVNLAHGSFYMLGAYFAATFVALTGSSVLGAVLVLAATLVVGMAAELIVIRKLYGRDHLDHVLGTFGLILFFNELVWLIWGPAGINLPLPTSLSQSIEILPDVYYPAYRIAIVAVGIAVAPPLYVAVMRACVGMLIRAGASNREMVGALGVNIQLLYTFVFGAGAALAGLAGLIEAPILTAQIGIGENILIVALVVIIIGGVPGRLHGGDFRRPRRYRRARLPARTFRLVMTPAAASALAPALSSMLIYLLMAVVLALRPQGFSCGQQMSALFLAVLLAYVVATGQFFPLSLFTRVLILALAATSLNLVLGYGGMVSFGHAAYLGLGGYVTGILAKQGITSGFVQRPLAIAASAVSALIVGALSLRARGEATEGLAPLIREEIWRCLMALKRAGQSIFVIDKNVDALIEIADRHYVSERGRITWSGTSRGLVAAPDVHHRYLGI